LAARRLAYDVVAAGDCGHRPVQDGHELGDRDVEESVAAHRLTSAGVGSTTAWSSTAAVGSNRTPDVQVPS